MRAGPARNAHWAWWLGALTAIGAAIRFAGLGRQSFWLDETVTASLLERSFRDMLDAVPDSESVPPLYYVVAWAWSRLVGGDEVGLRSLSALAGTLTIPVAYAAGAVLASRRAGLATAALAAVSPLLVWYSQEARAYALLVLFAALSFAAFARALTRPSAAALAAWSVTSALALLTHYFAAFLVVTEAAVLLARRPRRPTLLATAGIGVVGAALVPLALGQAGGSAIWIREVDLPLRIGETLRQLVLPSPPPIWAGAGVSERYLAPLWPLALLVLAVAGALGLRLGERRERRAVLVALGIGGATVLAPLALSVAGSVLAGGRGDFLLYRNVIVAWLPLALAVGGGLTVRRAGRLGLAALAVLLVSSVLVLAAMWRDERFQRDDWDAVAAAVAGRGRVIVLSPSWEGDALRYHLPGLVPAPEPAVRSAEIDLVVRRQAPRYTTLLTRFAPPPGFTRISRRDVQHWTVTRFRSRTPVRVTLGELERRTSGGSRLILVAPP